MLESSIHSTLPPVGLDEPHFDDEATLLSAQPVVPLAVVKRHSRINRLLFAAAIFVAMLAGVVSARLIYTKGPTAAEQGNQAATRDLKSASSPQNPDSPELTATTSPPDQDQPNPEAASVERTETERPSITLNSTSQVTKSAHREQPSKHPDENARLRDKEQTQDEYLGGGKRERRILDRRNRERVRPRSDLFRIPEIFEGSPEP